MSTLIKSKALPDGCIIEATTNPDAENPIKFAGIESLKYVTWHRRMTLGGTSMVGHDREVWFENNVRGQNIWWFSVFAYVHSGIALSLTQFSCRFDSGWAGFIVMDKAEAADCGYHTEEDVRAYLESLLEQVAAWCNGEVVTVNVYTPEGDIVDGCDCCTNWEDQFDRMVAEHSPATK